MRFSDQPGFVRRESGVLQRGAIPAQTLCDWQQAEDSTAQKDNLLMTQFEQMSGCGVCPGVIIAGDKITLKPLQRAIHQRHRREAVLQAFQPVARAAVFQDRPQQNARDAILLEPFQQPPLFLHVPGRIGEDNGVTGVSCRHFCARQEQPLELALKVKGHKGDGGAAIMPRVRLRHKCASAWHALDQPLDLCAAQCLSDGAAADLQLALEFRFGRQAVSGRPSPRQNRLAQLVVQLLVEGNYTLVRDFNLHGQKFLNVACFFNWMKH